MQTALGAIEKDESVRVVVIAGNGPAFCAGHDLKQMRATPRKGDYDNLFALYLLRNLQRYTVTLEPASRHLVLESRRGVLPYALASHAAARDADADSRLRGCLQRGKEDARLRPVVGVAGLHQRDRATHRGPPSRTDAVGERVG